MNRTLEPAFKSMQMLGRLTQKAEGSVILVTPTSYK